jgi:hypothetical protein
MTSEESAAFKTEVKPRLESAIDANGGIDRVRRVYGMMNSLVDFIAGWVCGLVLVERQRFNGLHACLSHEETRRIYDLVRLRLESASSTS